MSGSEEARPSQVPDWPSVLELGPLMSAVGGYWGFSSNRFPLRGEKSGSQGAVGPTGMGPIVAIGNVVTFKGYGARESGTVSIYIESTKGNILDEQTVLATGNGDFIVKWIISTEMSTGTYVIRADDSLDEVSQTFTLD